MVPEVFELADSKDARLGVVSSWLQQSDTQRIGLDSQGLHSTWT